MSNSQQARPGHQLLRELTVPAIMVVGIALFLYDSTHLSCEALVFPVVLIVVILAAIAWALVRRISRASRSSAADAEDDEEGGPIIAATPWLLVALPAVLVASFNYLGVLPALVLPRVWRRRRCSDCARPCRAC